MSSDIKIFMCTHKEFDILPAFTVAVQGGAALNPAIDGAISDVGELGSISEKNPDYCELTVQYYAWKNVVADYYGFCHYRRFLSFDENIHKPYLVFGNRISEKSLAIINDEEHVRRMIESCDVVMPKAEYMGRDVSHQYATSPSCTKEDFKVFNQLLAKSYPELKGCAEAYVSGGKQHFCNMFVMKKEIFFDYCEKLFYLLSEFDKLKDPSCAVRGDRVDGFLAERFLGIYVLYLCSQGKKIREVARIDVKCSLKKRILYRLLPPESKIRIFVKNAVKK